MNLEGTNDGTHRADAQDRPVEPVCEYGDARGQGDHDRAGRGVHGLRHRRARVPRRAGQPLVLQRRLRPDRARGRRCRADARDRRLPDLRVLQQPAGRGALPPDRGAGADAGRQGLPDPRRRLGRGRHGRQAGQGLLAGGRRADQAGHHLADARLSRDERLRHLARRHPAADRAVRAAGRPGRAGALGRPGGAGEDDRAARRQPGGRVLLRAGDRRRRCLPAARGLPVSGPRDLPAARRAVRRRRGDHRLRPGRRVVRQRPVRPRPRPDHDARRA